MYFAITIKRYRAVEEIGQIKMSVGVIAYYRLMQVCQPEYFRQLLKPVTIIAICKSHNSIACRELGVGQVTPFERVELQPSEVCPKNFIIFDQTDHQSRVMFHPAMAYKFSGSRLNVQTTSSQDFERNKVNQMERELSSPLEEDSDDIDALLSLEGEEPEDYDEEEVSTARSHECYESISDTCSSYCSKSRFSSSVKKSSGTGGYCDSERKHREMKRMVKVLRGILPDASDQMDNVAVLDEAVRYLKSLKVEVEKLGVEP
ncbi:hypothetical protein L6164_035457 [Bauhinia variegata]|uniref:Uncharacterized protein n=1 Tax=Bauhinia variegata TaxID=167791 RepID=A0ACB9KE10_BAUVA|nr:hypothetical protein L6164_035457 [Bauhinia variegata]